MKSLQEFYRIAEEKNIVVDHFALSKREALSIMDEDGACFIAIDPRRVRGEADERIKLAHEMGHCATGAFYNPYSSFDCRQKHENTADKWAIEQMISPDELDDAVAAGCTEIWELAEHFSVPEDFMRKAVCYYVNGNLAAELVF